ncbi:MAG TPA: phage capsid protein [Clostridiales bacterium]|nr:phage capsid protein [Clostridiales bacterium]
MAITLAEAKVLTQDKLAQIIIDEFRQDRLLDMMIFDNTVTPQGQSLAYIYNRVTTLSTAGFRAINSEYVAQEAKTTQITSNLKVFGGSFNVDRVIQNHVRGIADQVSFQMQQKIKATKAVFADAFFNGDSAVNTNSFDGIDKAITGSSTELVPDAVIDLSTSAAMDTNFKSFMDMLDKMLSNLDGTPTVLGMNRIMAAIMNGIARRSNYFSSSDVDAFGKPVLKYAGIPIYEVGDKPGTSNSIIGIDATAKTTSIFAMRVGLDGVHAASPEGDQLIKHYLPDMTLPGAVKTGEVEMVATAALKATRAAGALRKIKVQ